MLGQACPTMPGADPAHPLTEGPSSSTPITRSVPWRDFLLCDNSYPQESLNGPFIRFLIELSSQFESSCPSARTLHCIMVQVGRLWPADSGAGNIPG